MHSEYDDADADDVEHGVSRVYLCRLARSWRRVVVGLLLFLFMMMLIYHDGHDAVAIVIL